MIVRGRIGIGSTSHVSKVECRETGRFYARKTYRIDTKAVEYERAAIVLLRHLAHPNIVTYVEAVGRHIFMELVPHTLSRVLDLKPEAVSLQHQGRQLFEALVAIHSVNLAHLDVKPQNILLTAKYDVKLADFGLARQGGTYDKVVTLWYRPPELLQGGRAGCITDVWSAGCVLYEMVTQRVLFPHGDEILQLELILNTLKQPHQRLPMLNDMVTTLGRRLTSRECLEKYFESPNGEKRTCIREEPTS